MFDVERLFGGVCGRAIKSHTQSRREGRPGTAFMSLPFYTAFPRHSPISADTVLYLSFHRIIVICGGAVRGLGHLRERDLPPGKPASGHRSAELGSECCQNSRRRSAAEPVSAGAVRCPAASVRARTGSQRENDPEIPLFGSLALKKRKSKKNIALVIHLLYGIASGIM